MQEGVEGSMARIVMFGTHHHDPDGIEKLRRELGEENPDIVICEGSEAKLEGHQRYLEMLKGETTKLSVGRGRIRKFLAYEEMAGYEMKTAREFCESRGLPFFYFNDSGQILTQEERERNVARLIKVIQTINPDRAVEEIRADCKSVYRLLNSVVGDPQEIVIVSQLPDFYSFVGPRDAEMEAVARTVQGENPGKKISCVNGYYHTLRDAQGLSLYCRIRDLKPERILVG